MPVLDLSADELAALEAFTNPGRHSYIPVGHGRAFLSARHKIERATLGEARSMADDYTNSDPGFRSGPAR